MYQGLNIISAVYYAPVSEVRSIVSTFTGRARIEVLEWQKLRDVKGTSGFTIDDSPTKAGQEFEANLSLNLKEQLVNPGPVVVRIDLESGSSLLIGDKDLPVRFVLTTSLSQKNLKFSHKSWHYPYKLIP